MGLGIERTNPDANVRTKNDLPGPQRGKLSTEWSTTCELFGLLISKCRRHLGLFWPDLSAQLLDKIRLTLGTEVVMQRHGDEQAWIGLGNKYSDGDEFGKERKKTKNSKKEIVWEI